MKNSHAVWAFLQSCTGLACVSPCESYCLQMFSLALGRTQWPDSVAPSDTMINEKMRHFSLLYMKNKEYSHRCILVFCMRSVLIIGSKSYCVWFICEHYYTVVSLKITFHFGWHHQALLFLSYPLRSIHKIKSHHFGISYFTHKMKWVANFIPCLPLEKNLKIISPSLKIWQKACNLKHVSRALYYVFFSILLHVILLFLNGSAHSVCVCTVHPKIVLPCSFLNFQPQFWDVPRGTSVFHNGDRAAREAGEWEVYSRLP